MKKEYYTGNPLKGATVEPKPLPKSTRRKRDDPAGNRPDPGLIDAANVALILGRPLLLTGDPGVGKTSFAASLARECQLGDPLKFETKSTSVARDLFYTFDTLGRFKSRADGETNLEYIFWQALGEAIIQSRPEEEIGYLLNQNIRYQGPKRSLVLIDEIDKAPRDFPNDLLNEIERRFFRVPELDNKPVEAAEDLLPILVLTSNSETNLPDAFLRRCVYYHIPFPDRDKLLEIIATRIGIEDPQGDRLIQGALDLFEQLRSSKVGLSKPPSLAELIEWLEVLPKVGAVEGSPLRSHPEIVHGTLSVLIKTKEDRARAQDLVTEWLEKTD